MWLHRRSEEPSPTRVACYWAKPKLAGVCKELIKAKDLVKRNSKQAAPLPDNNQFLERIMDEAQREGLDQCFSKCGPLTTGGP